MGGGDPGDTRTAVALYALIGALLCATWLAFFHYLARNPHLVEDDVDDAFFPRERIRALAGTLLYVLAGVLGYLVAPEVALAIFLAVPIFYGFTSHGLDQLPGVRSGRTGQSPAL